MSGATSSSCASASARPGSPGSSARAASGAVGCRWAVVWLRRAIIAVWHAVAMDALVVESVRGGGVLDATRRHVVLVSGGRDSVCLLDVMAELCTPARLTALHVDYGLRGGGGNLQAWARDLRYARATLLAGADAAIASSVA